MRRLFFLLPLASACAVSSTDHHITTGGEVVDAPRSTTVTVSDEALRKSAAHDLGCPVESVRLVTPTNRGFHQQQYLVDGCNKRAVYVLKIDVDTYRYTLVTRYNMF